MVSRNRTVIDNVPRAELVAAFGNSFFRNRETKIGKRIYNKPKTSNEFCTLLSWAVQLLVSRQNYSIPIFISKILPTHFSNFGFPTLFFQTQEFKATLFNKHKKCFEKTLAKLLIIYFNFKTTF